MGLLRLDIIFACSLLQAGRGAPDFFQVPHYLQRGQGSVFFYPVLTSHRTLGPRGHSSPNLLRVEGRQSQKSGTIESPKGVDGVNYPPNINLVTPIPVKLGKFVLLTFREFDIETDSNPNKNCGYDYIKVEGEKYCGNNPPDFILSETNVMNVQFVTDDNTQLGGYIADWEEVSRVKPNNLIEVYENWGPEFHVTFDLFILETSAEKRSVMVFEGEYLKHVPLILLEDDDLIFSSIYTDFTGKGTERYQDVPLASWVKIDISQKKQIDGTYDYIITVNDLEVDLVKDTSASQQEEVNAWATSTVENMFQPADAIYKNLVIKPQGVRK